jgi:hypothetical protein
VNALWCFEGYYLLIVTLRILGLLYLTKRRILDWLDRGLGTLLRRLALKRKATRSAGPRPLDQNATSAQPPLAFKLRSTGPRPPL